MLSKKEKALANGRKFLDKGQFEKAARELEKATAEESKDARVLLKLAEIYVRMGSKEKARDAYLRTAEVYVEQGFFQRAVAVYKNILKLLPTYSAGHFKLAEIYKQLGLLSDAMQHYELATDGQGLDDSGPAIAAMRQLVDLNPEHAVSRIRLAETTSRVGLTKEAAEEFARAADILLRQGRNDEYLRVAERQLFHQPENVLWPSKWPPPTWTGGTINQL